jgi:hypothetical protein
MRVQLHPLASGASLVDRALSFWSMHQSQTGDAHASFHTGIGILAVVVPFQRACARNTKRNTRWASRLGQLILFLSDTSLNEVCT